ncbi:hypothetical protein C4D60_Mb11t08710 [Musa balbisiana]|uniref:Uncharacterized protein n=1 Tax=Musa balbisiana TaxID=52838 RepID=A0A4S8J2T2_MUSBA|nr:hypothetical protein C4D60_Mb11t08710 [Musa balbisiana]
MIINFTAPFLKVPAFRFRASIQGIVLFICLLYSALELYFLFDDVSQHRDDRRVAEDLLAGGSGGGAQSPPHLAEASDESTGGITVDLNSEPGLPYQWEQCLDIRCDLPPPPPPSPPP